jgi:hypothetical protein
MDRQNPLPSFPAGLIQQFIGRRKSFSGKAKRGKRSFALNPERSEHLKESVGNMQSFPFSGKGRKKNHPGETGSAEIFRQGFGLRPADKERRRKRGEKFHEPARKGPSFQIKMGQTGLMNGVNGNGSQIVGDQRQSFRKAQEFRRRIREGHPEGPQGRKSQEQIPDSAGMDHENLWRMRNGHYPEADS